MSHTGTAAFGAVHPPESRALIDACVHCGFCLPDVPDLRAVGRGDGLAAGPHLPDEGRPRRPRGDDAVLRPALRRLPRLHGVRHVMSVRRAVRAAHRGDARADRAALPALARRSPVPRRDLRAVPVSRTSADRADAAGHLPTAIGKPRERGERNERFLCVLRDPRSNDGQRRTTNDERRCSRVCRDAVAGAEGDVDLALLVGPGANVRGGRTAADRRPADRLRAAARVSTGQRGDRQRPLRGRVRRAGAGPSRAAAARSRCTPAGSTRRAPLRGGRSRRSSAPASSGSRSTPPAADRR